MAKSQLFEIEVERVEVKQRTQFGPRYAWQSGEYYDCYLNVTGRTIDGDAVYFDSPGIEMTVASGGPVAVVTFGKENDWLTSAEAYVVGANDNTPHAHPQSKVRVGQVLKVQGRIKKQYATGVSINYVKRVEA